MFTVILFKKISNFVLKTRGNPDDDLIKFKKKKNYLHFYRKTMFVDVKLLRNIEKKDSKLGLLSVKTPIYQKHLLCTRFGPYSS